jgi:hypothetical protein
MISKKTALKAVRWALYVFLTLALFLTWQIRKEFIEGPIPVFAHLGLFWVLFTLVSKIRSKTTDESLDETPDKKMGMVLKVIFSFVGLSLLLFLLAPLFL